jgi:hypothetical protein
MATAGWTGAALFMMQTSFSRAASSWMTPTPMLVSETVLGDGIPKKRSMLE